MAGSLIPFFLMWIISEGNISKDSSLNALDFSTNCLHKIYLTGTFCQIISSYQIIIKKFLSHSSTLAGPPISKKPMKTAPFFLAGRYVSKNNPSDCYTLGLFLLDYWYDLPYVRLISKLLRDINFKDCQTRSVFQKKLKRITFIAKIAFTPYDEWRLLCRRHLRIGWTKKAVLKKIKK